MKKNNQPKWIIQNRFSDIRANGLIEAICPHGIGHHKGVHGCDGCCPAPEDIWDKVTDEDTPAQPEVQGEEWEKEIDSFLRQTVDTSRERRKRVIDFIRKELAQERERIIKETFCIRCFKKIKLKSLKD